MVALKVLADGRIRIIDSVRDDAQRSPLRPVYLRVLCGRRYFGENVECVSAASIGHKISGCGFTSTEFPATADTRLVLLTDALGQASDKSRSNCTA